MRKVGSMKTEGKEGKEYEYVSSDTQMIKRKHLKMYLETYIYYIPTQ